MLELPCPVTMSLPPLILSFSPWEKGRLNKAVSVQHRPLSHGERDRVRGVTAVRFEKPAPRRNERIAMMAKRRGRH